MSVFLDENFSKYYLSACCKDTGFLEHVRRDLQPELFENKLQQLLVRLVIGYYDQYKTAPDDFLFVEINSNKDVIPKGLLEPLTQYVQTLLEIKITARQKLINEHDNFIRNRFLLQTLEKINNAGAKGDLAKVHELFQSYIHFRPQGMLNPGVTMDVDPAARIERRLKEDKEEFIFCIPELDQYGITFKRKHLCSLLSQKSSVGKTSFLAHLAKALVMQGKKVLIISTEETEEEYEDRIDQTVAGLALEDLTDYTTLHKAMLHWLQGKQGEQCIRIKKVGKRTTVADLRDFTTMLRNRFDFWPDVVIIDYADELYPQERKWVQSSYDRGKDVYEDLGDWADEENLAIFTAMQGVRSAIEATVAGQQHAGLSKAKIDLCDLVISINRTPEERKENLTTLFVVKYRHGQAEFSVTIQSDLARGLFYVIKRKD